MKGVLQRSCHSESDWAGPLETDELPILSVSLLRSTTPIWHF